MVKVMVRESTLLPLVTGATGAKCCLIGKRVSCLYYCENKDIHDIGTLTNIVTYAINSYVTNSIPCNAALPPRVDLSASLVELGDMKMSLYAY